MTGTRADFGKVKPLALALKKDAGFSVSFFVTGMHMLSRHGNTWTEVLKSHAGEFHTFLNQRQGDPMDRVLANTILGLSNFISENSQDMIVAHGDRVEALAAAAVGALNNIPVAHIEGGEVSGTVDESLRHAVSKLSNLHFVANEEAATRLVQLGEMEKSVFVIGSPDIDSMNSPDLPSLGEVRSRYELPNEDYCILIFHPVTTDLAETEICARNLLSVLSEGDLKVIVISPNNDNGSEIVETVFQDYLDQPKYSFFPSIRFEFFLTLLRNARFIIGNSSAGVREAPHYGVPAINIGTRQLNRARSQLIFDSAPDREAIAKSVSLALKAPREAEELFGDGKSAERFVNVLLDSPTWSDNTQKVFVDRR